jgi:hypothetical protein
MNYNNRYWEMGNKIIINNIYTSTKMKFSYAAIATTFALTDVQACSKEDTMWAVSGLKGFYTGYFKSFYKQELPADAAACLNEETIDNMISMEGLVMDPLHTVTNLVNIQEDVNIFAKMAEVFENLSTCHFEKSGFDLLAMCTKDPKACAFTTMTQNVSKDMFVLVGKFTSLAEVMQDFPSKDREDFGEQMMELGSTGGTWARVMFNFHHEGEEQSTHHYHHHHSEDDY